MTTMKALVHTAPYRLEISDFPVPTLAPTDVLVRVKAVGICGSDVQGYTGTTGRRLPPIILGHEAAGIVEDAGADAPALPRGMRVAFDSTIFCNACEACDRGQYNYCPSREVLGVSIPGMKRHGAMAEFVRLPWWTLVPMPDHLSFTDAALLEPIAISLHAAARGAIAPGETVCIIGAGTIGLFLLQAALLRGAGRIMVFDVNEHRLRVARALGADIAVSPLDTDPSDVVHATTEGRGADVSFEVVGIAATLHQAIAATRIGGRVVLVGNLTRSIDLNIPDIVSRELTLRGTYCNAGEYRKAIGLVADGKIETTSIVSATLSLEQGPEAFDRLHGGQEPELIKIILHP